MKKLIRNSVASLKTVVKGLKGMRFDMEGRDGQEDTEGGTVFR